MVQTRRWRSGEFPWLGDEPRAAPGVRVIVDNDFSGDPDDLYQLVHHLLSPSVEIRAVVGSHLADGDPFDPGPATATNACRVAEELLDLMGLDAPGLVVNGAEEPLEDVRTPRRSAAADAIIAEAMRDDVSTPLFVVCGGGLTDIASAYLLEPAIAERLTVVWIGGPEYPGDAFTPEGAGDPEYNLNIDVRAGQVVFNHSTLRLWQAPRNVYRQCLVSDIELRRRVAPHGAVGEHLYRAVRAVNQRMWDSGAGFSETYALGDSPLVLLTALQSHFQPDPSSSDYALRSAPRLDDGGAMVENPDGRPIRVYTKVDNRLMFEDFFLKLEAFAQWAENQK